MPFTAEEFFRVFARYNEAVIPAHIVEAHRARVARRLMAVGRGHLSPRVFLADQPRGLLLRRALRGERLLASVDRDARKD